MMHLPVHLLILILFQVRLDHLQDELSRPRFIQKTLDKIENRPLTGHGVRHHMSIGSPMHCLPLKTKWHMILFQQGPEVFHNREIILVLMVHTIPRLNSQTWDIALSVGV